MPEAARERAAYQASLRTIRRGERPVYRVMPREEGAVERPRLRVAGRRRERPPLRLDATRKAVAAWLNVEPDAFDVEL